MKNKQFHTRTIIDPDTGDEFTIRQKASAKDNAAGTPQDCRHETPNLHREAMQQAVMQTHTFFEACKLYGVDLSAEKELQILRFGLRHVLHSKNGRWMPGGECQRLCQKMSERIEFLRLY